jgi:hypothetical protein
MFGVELMHTLMIFLFLRLQVLGLFMVKEAMAFEYPKSISSQIYTLKNLA